MNFGWLKGVTDAAKGAGKTALLVTKAHAPEIMIAAGIGGFGLTVYEACRATSEARDILDEKEYRLDSLECERRCNDSYAEGQYLADVKDIHQTARRKLIRAYLPVGTTGLASVFLILGGYKILNGRYIGVAAAYKTLESGFNRYRGNVAEEFGEDTDWRMLHSVKKEDMEKALKEREDNKDIALENKGKLIKKKPATEYADIYDMYFDAHSERWKKYWNAQMMLDFLQHVEDQANDKLRIQGFLVVNDIADMLGLEKTAWGQVVGWIYNRGSFPYAKVDIGVRSMPEEEMRRILSTTRNEDLHCWLHFNAMGVIYQMIGRN